MLGLTLYSDPTLIERDIVTNKRIVFKVEAANAPDNVYDSKHLAHTYNGLIVCGCVRQSLFHLHTHPRR